MGVGRRILLLIPLLALSVLALIGAPGAAAQSDVALSYHFIAINGSTLEGLARGDAGEGILAYYAGASNADNPALLVRLSKATNATTAKAEVYGSVLNRNPAALQAGNKIDSTLKPDIIITTRDGWWVRDGVNSYNLDIEVYGPIASMWGAPSDSRLGAPAWADNVQPGELAARIVVGDSGHSGLPQWDLRSLVPPFPGQGFVRGNYAERKCATPLKMDNGISPLWPFVATGGSYEQPVGTFRPPIVVDWSSGKISFFSELVTVRNQNCTYAIYSLSPLTAGKHNTTDFEAPFAFYDLSGKGQGYPDLILRTQRQPVDDVWFRVNTGPFAGRLAPRDLETIRYSWADGAGNGAWDYKVEVLGFAPYSNTTTIADGRLSLDSPDWSDFPGWVVGQKWPAVTFVDSEAVDYKSSEGIYEWSPLAIGVPYLMGWQDLDPATVFNEINAGLRGEYRFGPDMTTQLYFSPIDNRLHLLGAQGGVLATSSDEVLREGNYDNGQYINSWTREGTPDDNGSATTKEAFYATGDYLIYAGQETPENTTVMLRRNGVQAATFTALPPTDAASKQKLADELAPYATQRRDPRNLRSWIDSLPGEGVAISKAALGNVRAIAGGFRFDLALGADFSVRGSAPGLEGLEPGRWRVSYDGKFHVEPLTAPQLSVSMMGPELTQREAGPLRLELSNSGTEDERPAVLGVLAQPHGGTASMAVTSTVTLLAGSPISTTLQWAPPVAGHWVLTPTLRLADGTTMNFAEVNTEVSAAPAPSSASLIEQVASSTGLPLLILTGAVLFMLAGLLVRRWLFAMPAQLDGEEV